MANEGLNLKSDYPEDKTFLGLYANTPAERARIKLDRRRQEIDSLKARFGISQKVINTAHTLKGEQQKQYLDNILPSLERPFPGISEQIKLFAGDKEGYDKVLNSLTSPKQKAIFESYIQAGDADSAISFVKDLYKKNSGSEFERLLSEIPPEALEDPSKIKDPKLKAAVKRVGVLSGLEMRRGEEESLAYRKRKQRQEFTQKFRKEADKGTEHFSTMESNISDALAAIESGDNALADTLLAQVLSQVNDTDIRALQMFQQFDKSYGNVAERTINSINRFISGDRSESETAMIRETLENFRDSHVRPGINKLKTQYRNMAIEEGVDPFKIVPPKTPEEIRDYPGITRDEKLRLLRVYFPERFRGK